MKMHIWHRAWMKIMRNFATAVPHFISGSQLLLNNAFFFPVKVGKTHYSNRSSLTWEYSQQQTANETRENQKLASTGSVCSRIIALTIKQRCDRQSHFDISGRLIWNDSVRLKKSRWLKWTITMSIFVVSLCQFSLFLLTFPQYSFDNIKYDSEDIC